MMVATLSMTEPVAWPLSFAEAFCEWSGSPPHRYESGVLWRCLACRLSLAGRLVDLVLPHFFADDRAAIRRLGSTQSTEDFLRELDDLDYVSRRRGGFLRLRLGMRASVWRLDRLRARLFHGQRPGPGAG
jgi:hypothetical protein